MPWIDEKTCIGCKLCVKECPVEGAIKMVGKKAQIDNDICTRCGKCFDVCPVGAIHSNSERPDLRSGNRKKERPGIGRSAEGRPPRDMGKGGGIGRGMGAGRGKRGGGGRGRGRDG